MLLVRYKCTDFEDPKEIKDLAKISFHRHPWKDTSWYKPTGMYREVSRTVYFQYQDLQEHTDMVTHF